MTQKQGIFDKAQHKTPCPIRTLWDKKPREIPQINKNKRKIKT